MELKSLIDQVRESYTNMRLDDYYHEIEHILAQENYAVDKAFLKERISQTSKFLSEAIQELTRPKSTVISPLNDQAKPSLR